MTTAPHHALARILALVLCVTQFGACASFGPVPPSNNAMLASQERIRLRLTEAGLRRVTAVHSIPIDEDGRFEGDLLQVTDSRLHVRIDAEVVQVQFDEIVRLEAESISWKKTAAAAGGVVAVGVALVLVVAAFLPDWT
ncbi:MAG: hypothetical protein OXQ94_06645 [Gemmatimonadota bacterium]|nr:hypothetical protein [Gemmatimonadota bacterium]MDE2871352.1 hypothetical protein [Gemmatimonadota bacterium]